MGYLTKRQKEVCKLAIQGYKNQEIADKMGINVNSVKQRLHYIFRVLNIQKREQIKEALKDLQE